MIDLNDTKTIKNMDKSRMYQSIEQLGLQVNQSWEDSGNISLPYKRSTIENICVSGVGGSALGARIINSLYIHSFKIPFIISNHFNIPEFVNKNTLFIASSYSGNTEESVSSIKQAIKQKAMIVVIASGGKFIRIAKKYQLPYYQIKADYNPCKHPRMALGYSIIGQLQIYSQLGLLTFNGKIINDIQNLITRNNKRYSISVPFSENNAKQLAHKIYKKIPFLIGSDHLGGVVHAAKNLFNENSKNYADKHEIPEMNHHMLEGLTYPTAFSNSLIGTFNESLIAIFCKSNLYNERCQEYLDLTIDIISKNNIPTEVVQLESNTKILQAFELLHFMSFVTYYLALLNGVDPSPIPWVDYFKEILAK